MSAVSEKGFRLSASDVGMHELQSPTNPREIIYTPGSSGDRQRWFGPAELLEATDHHGKYQLGNYQLVPDQLLATGSRAIVVAGFDSQLGTDLVALRVDTILGPDAERDAREKAELARRVAEATEFVPQVYGITMQPLDITIDIGGKPTVVHGEFPVTATEIVNGESLGKKVDREGRLGLKETVTVLRPIAAALDAEHALGVGHRDVSPNNILLADTVKLIDFDTAFEYETVVEMDFVGTTGYRAPEEQHLGNKINPSVDIWKLGAVAYKAITSERLIPGSTIVANMEYTKDEKTYNEHIRTQLEKIPEPAREAFLGALAFNPEERSSATEFIDKLAVAAERANETEVTAPQPVVEASSVQTDVIAPVETSTEPTRRSWTGAAGRAWEKAKKVYRRAKTAEIDESVPEQLDPNVDEHVLFTHPDYVPMSRSTNT